MKENQFSLMKMIAQMRENVKSKVLILMNSYVELTLFEVDW